MLKPSISGNHGAENGEMLAADAKLRKLCRGTSSIKEARDV